MQLFAWYMPMHSQPNDRNTVFLFARANLEELCRDVYKWRKTGNLAPGSCLRQLALMYATNPYDESATHDEALGFAVWTVEEEALQRVASQFQNVQSLSQRLAWCAQQLLSALARGGQAEMENQLRCLLPQLISADHSDVIQPKD